MSKRRKIKNPDTERHIIVLQKTRHISENDIEKKKKWADLKEWYVDIEEDKDTEWITRAVQSILNSIVYQDREWFCMSRNMTRCILKDDKNWKPRIGLQNKNYSRLTSVLVENGYIEIVKKEEKKLTVYKLVDEEILSYLTDVDKQYQLEEAMDFSGNETAIKSVEESVEESVESYEGTQSNNVENAARNSKGPRVSIEYDNEYDLPSKVFDNEKSIKNKNNLGDVLDNSQHTGLDAVSQQAEITPKIGLRDLLYIQHPDGWPSYVDIAYLVSLAIENCEEYDDLQHGRSAISIFETHLKSLNKSKDKMKGSQLELFNGLLESFDREALKQTSIIRMQSVDIIQPDIETKVAIKVSEEDIEALSQSNTKNMLLSQFIPDKLQSMKRRIENASDADRPALQAELSHWERVL